MGKVTKFNLVQPRPSPKMDVIFNAMEAGFPDAKRNNGRDSHNMLWGLIGNNVDIMRQYPNDYTFIDMPYHGRLQNEDYENSYWRFARSSLHDTRQLDVPSDRFEQWNVELKPYQTDGEFVLICPSSESMSRYMFGVTQDRWVSQVYNQVKSQTNMPVKVRYKPRKNGTSGPGVETVSMIDELQGCHALVTSASLTAIEALQEGVPVFSNCQACPSAWCTNTDFDKINNPLQLDREQLFFNLAYKQYSIKEIRDGTSYETISRFIYD